MRGRAPWLLVFALPALAETPEQRAVQYLAREAPRWSRENRCFSCHNNGDGARALYAARRLGFPVPAEALADTTRWLLDPGGWDNNRGNPAFSDRKLARIQFAAALAAAYESGVVGDRAALVRAARSLAPYQEPDGSWAVDTGTAAGSPATWGTALATHMARHTLMAADDPAFTEAIARAARWLLKTQPRSTPEIAAVLLAGPARQRERLDMLLSWQAGDGGWGPHAFAPAEAFDTALALLALENANEPQRTRGAIARGRAFLISAQQPSGGWPETTRPPGAQSYAQHISTSGWATLALLATR